MKNWFVYLLASRRNGTLYCGVTNNLERRTWQHRNGYVAGFTARYGVHRLVWFDIHHDVNEAIAHEKRLKRWRRVWKLELIEKTNPGWRDLYFDLITPDMSSRNLREQISGTQCVRPEASRG